MHIGLRNSSDIQRYPAREAARRTWQDLIAPVFWSLATTAVGFVSLVVSVIIPVRQFG